MAHGLDGCDGFSLIFFFGFNGTRIRRMRLIFLILVLSKKIRENLFNLSAIKSKKENQRKSVLSVQSVCHK